MLTGEYSTPEFRARFTRQARDAAERADAIIAVSAFTRSQVIDLLHVDPARVYVVHHGIRKLPPCAAAVVREPVILNVGAIQKRKNIARLIEAFETVDPAWKLVLAGSNGFGAAEILERIAASPARARILTTGYISPDQLAQWYSRASIFAFPSQDEGFGMPVLEAMAAGIPVVTSNSSALPEVAGDAALLIDPADTGALAHALRELTVNVDLRESLILRGIERGRTFSWEKAVRETWDVYRKILS